MLALAAWSCGQETAPAPPQRLPPRDALAAAPAGGLLDEGNVFNAEEEVLVAAELEDFRHRAGLPAYIVTANYIFGETVEQYGERLVTEWSKGKPGLVLLYERGSAQLNFSATPGALGRTEDMKVLFLSASRAAATMPGDSTAAQRLRTALHGLTLSAETWKMTGALPGAPPELANPTVPVSAKTESLPAAPVDFVVDDADAFDLAAEAGFKTELINFHSKNGMDIYVATYTFLPDSSAQLWAERLAREWLKDRTGAVLVMNRGAGTNEQSLGIAGTVLNEQLLTSAALFKAMEEAKQRARTLEAAPQGSQAKGLRGAADHLMQAFTARAGSTDSRAGASGQRGVITSLAAALVIGTALLFLFHRVQERLERRVSQQWIFPDVTVGCRLGAPQGGGQVAGVFYGKKAKP